jgi:hypothetical protein
VTIVRRAVSLDVISLNWLPQHAAEYDHDSDERASKQAGTYTASVSRNKGYEQSQKRDTGESAHAWSLVMSKSSFWPLTSDTGKFRRGHPLRPNGF